MDPDSTSRSEAVLSLRFRFFERSIPNTDAASVLEFLHVAYADVQGRDPLEIEQGFVNLDNHLEGLSLDENNKIFSIVCGLCNAYEKRAFIDAIQIGAYLMMEVQAKKQKKNVQTSKGQNGHSFFARSEETASHSSINFCAIKYLRLPKQFCIALDLLFR